MSRTAAKVTQADVARVVRAAKQAGAPSVTVKVGQAEIIIDLAPRAPSVAAPPVDKKRTIIL